MTVVEDIQANVKTQLAAIVAGAVSTGGHTFNFTPKVARVPAYVNEDLDGTKESSYPLYLIRDTGDETLMEPERFGDIARRLMIPILVCKQDRRTETDPFRTAVDAGTIRNQMIGDVMAKLAEDDRRGQGDEIAVNTEFPRTERSFFVEAWIIAEVNVLVTFRHARDKP